MKIEHRDGLSEVLRFQRDRAAYVAEIVQGGIDVRHLQRSWRHLYIVNNPELIGNILITHDWNFIKGRSLRNSKPMLGDGLLTSEGEVHRRQRRMVQPAFHSARLASFASAMTECSNTIANEWRDGQKILIGDEMMRLTLAIVGRTLFSADLLHEADNMGALLTESLKLFIQLNHPLVQLIAPLRYRKVREAYAYRKRMERVVLDVVQEHRKHPEKYDDMLSMLLGASEDESAAGYMSDSLLLDECLTLFLAGHETTANALNFTWYLLSEHPEVEAKLHAELAEVLGGRTPELADLQQLPFTTAVFKETLRLYPPAWIITREAVTPYQLGELQVAAGANLMMSPLATHRDPRFWPDADKFIPDRWLADASTRTKFAFFPFGAGTRNCIGENFATMEGVLAIATLAQRFRLRFDAGQTIMLWPQLTLRAKEPMRFTVTAR